MRVERDEGGGGQDERTPAHWRAHCERILRGVHPDYRAEGPYSARRIEVRRTLPCGVMVSHSWFAPAARDYHQGFALMWSTAAEKSPYSLFRVGTRFYDRPLPEVLAMDGIPRPAGLREQQTWRSNSLELLERSVTAAEEALLPRYLAIVERGSGRLARFFATAGDTVERLPKRLPRGTEERTRLLALDPELVEPYRSRAWVVTATDILTEREPYSALPEDVRDQTIVLGRLDDLVHAAPELPSIRRVLEAL